MTPTCRSSRRPQQALRPDGRCGPVLARAFGQRGWRWLAPCWIVCLLSFCQREPPAGTRRRATAYDAYRRPEQLVAALNIRPGEALAEIGAGSGYLTGRLAQAVGRTGRVVATDIDEAALAALKERTRGLAQVEPRRVSATEPGLEPGRYDLILLAQVDHLLADQAAYLRALLPALKPGGRIALSNSVRYREPLRAALSALALRCEERDAQLPGQFLCIVRPPGPSADR